MDKEYVLVLSKIMFYLLEDGCVYKGVYVYIYIVYIELMCVYIYIYICVHVYEAVLVHGGYGCLGGSFLIRCLVKVDIR